MMTTVVEIQPQAHHLLVVDDDQKLCDLLVQFLGSKGFYVSAVKNLTDARVALDLWQIDLVLLDVMMPGEDGFTFFSWPDPKPPALFLTARGEVEDRLKGLSLGAYDYLPKPFEPEELVLRIQSILRRRPRARTLTLGDLTFCPYESTLRRGAEPPVTLTESEQALLKLLLAHKNTPLSREDMAAEMARLSTSDMNPRSIDVRIARLRAKMEKLSDRCSVKSVRGVGYMVKVAS